MFAKMRMKHRILLGYCFPILLSLLTSLVVFYYSQEGAKFESMVDHENETMLHLSDLESAFYRMQSSALRLLMMKDDALTKAFQDAEKDVQKTFSELHKATTDEKQRQRITEISQIINEYVAIAASAVASVNEGRQEKALEALRSGLPAARVAKVHALFVPLFERQTELNKQRKSDSARASNNLDMALIIGNVLIIILSLSLGLWIVSGASKTISQATSTLSASAKEIAATVTQHERTALSQASMVNETNVTVDELKASSKQTGNQATEVVDIARKASNLSDEGNTVVSQAVEGITGLRDKVGVVAEQVLQLGEQTNQIGAIANLVKDLATQTNMLALNAAVEAARAGEQGKGFAVVAGEVRKLADQSKKSAEEASVIISDIQKATNSTIMITEESTKTVEEVSKIAHKVGQLFNALSAESNRVYENAQQVVLNAQQQATAINQISEAMSTINASTKETAAGITQTKIGAQNVEQAAQSLQSMV